MAGRKGWIAAVVAAGAVLAAAGVAFVVLRTEKPPEYKAGEQVEGISSELSRSLPPDYPRITFRDVAREAGIAFVHFGGTRSSRLPEDMGPGAAWGDIDGDDDDDLFLPNFAGPMDASGHPSATGPTHGLFRNRGDGTFEDVTAPAGLAIRDTGLGAAFGDVDGDGDLDLLVTTFGPLQLFRNRGDGTFEDISAASGAATHEGFWSGASWSDYDRDGDLDLYVCGYVRYVVAAGDESRTSTQYQSVIPFTLNPSSFEPERNLLLRNDGSGRFADVAEQAGVANPTGRSLSATWADYDEDGDPDLYVANDVSDNALYLNRGDGTFEDVSHAAWVADYRGAMGLGLGDPDGDLDLDIFITHWIAQENALYRSMLRDQRAKGETTAPLRFVDIADREGLGQIALPVVGWGTDFVDYDGDGRQDIVAVNGSTFQESSDPTKLIPMRNFLFWNAGSKRGFFDVAAGSGEAFAIPRVGRGAALSDYDGDGDVDIAVANHGASTLVLRNDGGNANAWLGVRLASPAANRFGVGARIEVEAGGLRQVRVVGGGSSYLSQSSLEAMFGLGQAARVDVLEIRWPSGHVDTLRDVPARAHVRVEEGGALRVLASASPAAPASPARDAGAAAPEAAAHVGAEGAVTLTGQAGLADASALDREAKKAFWSRYETAQAARRKGDLAAAVTAFQGALEVLPRHDDSLYWLGNCCFELERHDEALQAYTRLVESNPLSGRGHQQLGVLHATLAEGAPFDLALAEQHFRRALEINKEESGPMTRLGEILLVRGKDAEALDMLSASARLNPKAVSALYLVAHLHHRAGRQAEALALLGRAAKALEEDRPVVKGTTSEGDTQEHLRALHRAALRKSLFGSCWEGLRERVDPAAPAPAALEPESTRIEELLAKLRQ